MNCRKTKVQAGRYLDGELPARERLSLEEHLRDCPVCAEEVRSLRVLGSLIRSVTVPPPPAGLARRILARARSERTHNDRRGWIAPWWAWSLPMRFAAAGMAVAAVWAGLAASHSAGSARETSELAWLQTRPPVVAAYQGVSR